PSARPAGQVLARPSLRRRASMATGDRVDLLERYQHGRHRELGLTDEDVRRMYEVMLLARRLDERMWILNRTGQAPFAISGQGHEAAQVGAAWALDRERDWIYPYYRDVALVLVWGLTPRDLMLQLLGKAADPSSGGRQMPNHFSSRRLRIAPSPAWWGPRSPRRRERPWPASWRAPGRSPWSPSARAPRPRATSTRGSTLPPSTGCPSSFSARTTATPSPSRRRRSFPFPTWPTGPWVTASPASLSTATTPSKSTGWCGRRWSGLGPARALALSRPRPTGSSPTPATTTTPRTAPGKRRRPGGSGIPSPGWPPTGRSTAGPTTPLSRHGKNRSASRWPTRRSTRRPPPAPGPSTCWTTSPAPDPASCTGGRMTMPVMTLIEAIRHGLTQE